MIENISNYAETIIILIIAMTIVELILPNSKNKKYVMFVSSLIIMLSVINPILSVFNSNFDISKKVQEIQNEMQSIEYTSKTNYNLESNIYNAYSNKLEENMKNRLNDIGYEVLESEVIIDETTYEPTEIEMKVRYKDGEIQPIVIDVFGDAVAEDICEMDINEIKEVLFADYGVNKNSIKINEK